MKPLCSLSACSEETGRGEERNRSEAEWPFIYPWMPICCTASSHVRTPMITGTVRMKWEYKKGEENEMTKKSEWNEWDENDTKMKWRRLEWDEDEKQMKTQRKWGWGVWRCERWEQNEGDDNEMSMKQMVKMRWQWKNEWEVSAMKGEREEKTAGKQKKERETREEGRRASGR